MKVRYAPVTLPSPTLVSRVQMQCSLCMASTMPSAGDPAQALARFVAATQRHQTWWPTAKRVAGA